MRTPPRRGLHAAFIGTMSALAMLVVFAACTNKEPNKGPFRVLLPWPGASGTYSLQEVQINTIEDRIAVSGAAGKLFVQPTLSSSGLTGSAPLTRLIETAKGLFVPTDDDSYQMYGLYAHAEKLWELDRELGIESWLVRPRHYGYRANMVDENGSTVKNNAAAFTDINATVITVYNGSSNPSDKQLPLTLNAGVLAHEHFHALFYSAVISKIEDEALRKAGLCLANMNEDLRFKVSKESQDQNLNHNGVMMRAANEGLADIWGWIYTGDDKFMSHSLPQLSKERVLRSESENLTVNSKAITQNLETGLTVIPKEAAVGRAYRIGTEIARQIRALVPAQATREDRIWLAKRVIDRLPLLREDFVLKSRNVKLISAQRIVDIISVENINDLKPEELIQVQQNMDGLSQPFVDETESNPTNEPGKVIEPTGLEQ